MTRRILGLAHVEDMESIADPDLRATCEKRALKLARSLMVERASFSDIEIGERRGARDPTGDHDVKVDGKPYRTIWLGADGTTVQAIDQTLLPHRFVVRDFTTVEDAERAIRTMIVRGAPLIGAAAAYGMALAMAADPSDADLARAYKVLLATRPTAVNLRWALDDLRALLAPLPQAQARARRPTGAPPRSATRTSRSAAASASTAWPRSSRMKPRGERLNVLTHCNAGWLATVDWGTALAPIYTAHDAGIPVHVWVDETRPRNQGASLTAWELGKHGVPHTVIADNAGGHLMQHGKVDFCIVGTDRTTRRGDVCNKIGTYLKALAAHDNGVPFYVGLPSPTIDWTIEDGALEIPIEERDARRGLAHRRAARPRARSSPSTSLPEGSPAANPAFDVTPARLVTGLITERGVCAASEAGLLSLYPEQARAAA